MPTIPGRKQKALGGHGPYETVSPAALQQGNLPAFFHYTLQPVLSPEVGM